jgi:hypothetical protein
MRANFPAVQESREHEMEVLWIIGVDDRDKHPYIGVPKHHASFTLYAGD